MQVSTQNSLTWLQTTPAAVAAADQISSAYGQVSPNDDGSGAEAGQSAISALQSPAQMFSPASLNTLISSQSGADGTGAASTATSAVPTHGHHHHHHGGAGASSSTQAGDASGETFGAAGATGVAAGDAADTSAQADLDQVLTEM